MKKISSIILSVILLFTVCTSVSATKLDDIDKKLAPYQEVIDKLNTELGTTFFIPDENKEKFYNNIKDISPNNFEKILKCEYKNAVDSTSNTNHQNDSYQRSSGVGKESSGPGFIPNFKGSINVTLLNYFK